MSIRVETDKNGIPFITLGEYQLRLDLEDISGEFEERARTELLETPERVQEGLERFRELIKAEKGLELPIEDDKFLLKFLRPFKCNAEHAFKMMRKFYKFKIKYPKYGGLHATPDGVRHVFDSEVFMFLPTRSLYGGRIMIINAGSKWKPKEVTLEDMFRSIMVAIEIAMMEPKTQVGGVNVILNMDGLSMSHVYQFSPFMAKLIVYWVQECAPVRLRGIHVINQPYIFNMLYAVFKPFLGEYLKKRLSFHGTDFKSLCEKIGQESLPPKLGGVAEIPEYQGSAFSDMLFYYQDVFKLFHTYGYVKELKEINLNSPEKKEKANGTVIKSCSKTAKWKPKEVTLEDMFRSIMVAIEIAMMEPKTQVGGVNVILNMDGLSMSHVYQFSPFMAKLIVYWVQECAPVRLRGIHVINQPYIFNMLYAVFKPFLGEYLKKRLSFHGTDFKSLCEKIGQESLPPKLGGVAEIPEYQGSAFSDMLFYYQDVFKLFHTYGYVKELKEINLNSPEKKEKANGTVIKSCSKTG